MGRTQYKKSSQTQDRILNVAEDLFAKQGFDATTTRQITAAAGVRNASVNYYFETKRDLLVAVIDRRFDVLRLEREAMLARVDNMSDDWRTRIQTIVEAFVFPLATLTKSDLVGWSNYNRIMAQIALRSEWPKDDYSVKVNKTAEEFVISLQTASPNASHDDAVGAYQFMLGAMLFAFAASDRFMRAHPNGSATYQTAVDPLPLVAFVTAGLIQLFDVDH